MISETNWSQFAITLLISSIGLMWMLSVMLFKYGNVIKTLAYMYIIKFKTGRPTLLIRHSTQGLFSSQMIDIATLNSISAFFEKNKNKAVNIILKTPGGMVFPSMLASNIIRSHKASVHVYVSQYAMSGGTLLALSGTDLYMSPIATLGPIDPQIGDLFTYGPARGYDEVLRRKGKTTTDKSILMRRMGLQCEQDIKEHITSLFKNKIVTDEKVFLNLLIDGKRSHGHMFSPQVLSGHIPVMMIPNTISKHMAILNSIETEKGVYQV